MACRFLLAVLIIIWGEQANGHELVDVNAACCGHYRQQRWDEYTHCVNRYGVVPACDGSRRGCYYGNQFFTVGETVAIIPEKCIKLVCVCITVHNNDDQSWLHLTDDGQMVADNSHTVQMKIVHVSDGCGCCQHDGEMFPNGTMKILDRSKCNISICVDGEWVPIQDDPCGPRNNGVRSNNRMDDIDTDDDLKTIRNTLHNPSFGDQELPLHGENTKDGGRMGHMQKSRSSPKDCNEKANDCQLNCSNSSAQCHNVCQSDFDECMGNRSDNARTFDGGVPENRIVYRRPQCCVYNLQHYFHGETIAIINDTYGRGCRKMYCYNSYIYTQNYECCCVEGNEVYSCYGHTTLPSSDHETCTIRKCCDGTIETSHEPGCCNENGIVYRPGAYLGYTSDYCHRKRCMEGKVIYEDTGYCCKDHGKYYKYGSIVELNAMKCILKVCYNEVIEKSKDTCPCCYYRGKLYVNGSHIYPSVCLALQCVEGKWVDSCTETTNCPYCYIGSHYKTFDDVTYHYDAYCNSTLVVSRYYNPSYYSFNAIYLSFKRCSLPFSNSLSCNDVLTIRHSWYSVVTIRPGGHVEVNGNPVTEFPIDGHYNHPFIYETANAIVVVTFLDIVVQYGKGFNPTIRIYAPTWARFSRIHGLCGAYNGFTYRDLTPQTNYYYWPYNNYYNTIDYFVNSWKSQDPCETCTEDDQPIGRNCSSFTETEMTEIENDCEDLYDNAGCNGTSLSNTDYVDACKRSMCACLPCQTDQCWAYLLNGYNKDCVMSGGTINRECSA